MMPTLFGLALIGIFAYLILHFEEVVRPGKTAVIAAVAIIAAFALRALCMNYETLDYQNFLTKWVSYFAENGGFRALSKNIGNYNVPYLYFLAAFSMSRVKDLYLIKLLSIFFDVILAWGVMRLVHHFTQSRSRVLASFLVVLFLPTVVLNGALWGQCDSIYTAFVVWSLYFALRSRGILAMVFAAIAFSFKLQAIFVFPVFFLFLLSGKIKWYHLAAFPVTYIVMVSPAVILGRPFIETLTLYFSQAGTIGSGLNYNSPSVFAFVRGEVDTALLSSIGITAAFVFIILCFAVCMAKRSYDDRALLICSVLFSVAVPFLLPHMHDRYFFTADILTLAMAFVIPIMIPIPLCASFASLLGYHAYLKMRYLLPMRYGSWALIIVIIALFSMLLVIPKNSVKKVQKKC